jgi:hypothetical protein
LALEPQPHVGVTAHESCLARAHHLLQLARQPCHSPLPHRRGMSVPNDCSPVSSPLSPPISGGLHDPGSSGDRLHWVLNFAKNDKNRQNLLQVRSSPCTRASSPDLFRALLAEEALLRRRSENDLGESGSDELRRSYARYLYGSGGGGDRGGNNNNKVSKSNSDDNVGWKTRSNPNLVIDEAVPSVPDRIGRPQVLTLSPADNRAPSPFPDSKLSPSRLSPTVVLERSCGQLNLSGGSMPTTPTTPTTPDAPSPDPRTRPDTNQPPWSNKQKMDEEQLNNMKPDEIKAVVAALENRIKDISAELVDLLQDRDSLGQEVRFRNLTIQKLVKMKHSQQDTPLKTTGVGNI